MPLPTVRPLAIAHRAGNSLHAARDAFAYGADYIEADVYLRGGHVEIRHSKTVPGAPWLPVRWDRRELRLALRPLRLPGLLHAATATTAPTQLLLDLKRSNQRLSPAVLAEIERSGFERPYAVCARDWRLLEPFAGRPAVTVFHSAGTPAEIEAVARLVRGMGQPAHLSVDGRVVDGPAIQRLREAGAETIICWGVNTGQAWERLTAWGIDGITSDNRLLLREIVEGRRAKGEG